MQSPLNNKSIAIIKPHQRLFLHPTFHPNDASRKQMQIIYANTCGPDLKDLLDIRQLTIAYHRPKNLRDILMPSKLWECEGQENQVETYLQETGLDSYVETIDHKKIRSEQIKQESALLQEEIKHINQLAIPAMKQLICNPCTKQFKWTNILLTNANS